MSMQSGYETPSGSAQGASSVQGGPGYSTGGVQGAVSRAPRESWSEAKNGFKTSEFYIMVLFVAGVLLATYLDKDSLSRNDGWRYAALAVGAYILSRGLAKLGVREPRADES